MMRVGRFFHCRYLILGLFSFISSISTVSAEKKTNESSKESGFSIQAQEQFCLRVRGHIISTPSLLSYLFWIMHTPLAKIHGTDSRFLVELLQNGYGDAIQALLDDLPIQQQDQLKQWLNTSSEGSSRWCPLACHYKEISLLRRDLTITDQDRIKQACMGQCQAARPVFSAEELDQCRCSLLDQFCERLPMSLRSELAESKRQHWQKIYYTTPHRKGQQLLLSSNLSS